MVFVGIDANLQDSLTEIARVRARVTALRFPMLKDNNNKVADRLGGAMARPRSFCSIASGRSAIGAASMISTA